MQREEERLHQRLDHADGQRRADVVGQGISSSLIYFLVVPMKDSMPWYVLMILIYGINIILAFIISAGLKKVDEAGWKTLQFLRRKTAAEH